MLFSGIPRIRLLNAPTPLCQLARAGKRLGNNNLYVKRDDLMPLAMGGNKVRSLEFWLGDAISQGADVILVAGTLRSNMCRLTAAAAATLNIRCVVLHNDDEPATYSGNMLLNRILGVETVFLGKVDEHERSQLVSEYADRLRSQGHKPYIVGDPVIGALGYVNGALELIYQAESGNIDLKHVFICGSMGTTEAGLLYGLSLFGKSFKLHVVSVEYELRYLKETVHRIFDGLCSKLRLKPPVDVEDVAQFYDDYLGEGYGKPTPDSIEAIRFLANTEGIFLENTYNAKVFAGMFDLVRRGVIDSREAVCCFHTGGIPTLFEEAAFF